jgi:protein-disulfide isomerase
MNDDSTDRLVLPVGERDHIQGPPHAQALLVEYGDYECPFCGAEYVVIKEVQKSLGDRLGFVFRNFPLSEIHPHAAVAAQAAEAAAAQGAFWEMHDMLFENQDKLELDDIVGYATTLGLNVSRLANEIETGTYAKRIREDFRSGVRSGVNGTPTLFINGVRYDGPRDPESLISALTFDIE